MVSAVGEPQETGFKSEAGIEPEAPVTLIGSEWLHATDLRFDAGYYNAETVQAHHVMATSGLKMQRLGDVTESIFIPPRFKRVYVDQAYGVPFLQGTHLVHFRPTDVKYLSRSAHKNLDRWIIKAGWVLVTCSGTSVRSSVLAGHPSCSFPANRREISLAVGAQKLGPLDHQSWLGAGDLLGNDRPSRHIFEAMG